MYGTLEGDPIHLAGSPKSRGRYYGHSSSPRSRYHVSYSDHAARTTISRSLGPSLGRSFYMGSGHVSTAAHTVHAPSTPVGSGTFRRTFDGIRPNSLSGSIVHHGAVHY